MTILPIKPHNQKKDDVAQRPDSVTRDPRASRQRHGARERANRVHTNEQPRNPSAEFPYLWNRTFAPQDIDQASYNERPQRTPSSEAILPAILPEAASTSGEIPWRIPSPLDPPVPVDNVSETVQPWHRNQQLEIENKTIKVTNKAGDKKVCAKRRQSRTTPYNIVRQKHSRTNVHLFKPDTSTNSAGTTSARPPTIPSTQVINNSNVNSAKSEIFNAESDHLTSSSHQATKPTGSEPNQIPPTTEITTNTEDKSGYESDQKHNSDDEYDPSRLRRLHKNVDFVEIEKKFEQKMKEKRKFIIRPMVEDGACLFRAVSDQVYGDQNMHDVVRRNCMDYMLKNADFFKNYVTEDFPSYISRKRKIHTHGNHLEIQAMAELYNRPFEVYQYSIEPINTFHATNGTDNVPVRLSYHQNSHYNSVVDPFKATVGVGLGLPAYKPGQADDNLVKSAVLASEQQLLEEQMFHDKVSATDWESTEEAVLKHVAMQSYKQYVEKNITKNNSDSKSKAETSTSTPKVEKPEAQPTTSTKVETKTPPSGASNCVSDWINEEEEWQVLSRVMAESQQEYIDSFKQSKPTCSKYTS